MVPAKVRKCEPNMYSEALSSCYRLLAHITLQTFIWIVGGLALFGNCMVLALHYCQNTKKRASIPTFLVTNLAVSDLLMSLYLLIIAIADLIFSGGNYGIESEKWLSHPFCFIACFLATLSSLTSVLVMITICVDRYICIVYPFSTRRMTIRTAKIVIATLWLFSIIFSATPIIFSIGKPGHLRIYKYSSMCMPNNYQNYYQSIWMLSYLSMTIIAWVIMIGLYLRIFMAVQESSKNIRKSSSTDNKTLAIRLALILVSDLATWLPYYYITAAGLLRNGRVDTIALQFIATFLLPINSAINPYLYTLTSIDTFKLIFRRKMIERSSTANTFTHSTIAAQVSKVSRAHRMETFVNTISED